MSDEIREELRQIGRNVQTYQALVDAAACDAKILDLVRAQQVMVGRLVNLFGAQAARVAAVEQRLDEVDAAVFHKLR